MMYKLFKIFAAHLCVVSLLLSCSEDSALQQGSADVSVLPLEDVKVHPLGDRFSVAYTSTTSWKVVCKDDATGKAPTWIDAPSDISRKMGTTVLEFVIDPNVMKDRSDRRCTVSFFDVSKNAKVKSFVITQDAVVLEVDNESLDFGWKKDKKQLRVNSNVEWTLQVNGRNNDKFDVVWESVDATVDEVEEKLCELTTKTHNFSTDDLTAEIRIRPVKRNNKGDEQDFTSLETKVALSQDFLVFLVDDSVEETMDLQIFSELGKTYVSGGEVNADDHRTEQTVTVVSEADWEINQDAFEDDWGLELVRSVETETVTVAGRDAVKTTLDIIVNSPNPGKVSREELLELYVDAGDAKASRNLKVIQEGYQFTGTLEGTETYENMGGERTLDIRTRGPWFIEESLIPEWLSVSPVSGIGDGTIVLQAKGQNLNFKDNTANITVKSALNDLTAAENFTQDKFIFEVEGMENFKNSFSRLDLTEHPVTVTSSGAWSLDVTSAAEDDGEDWLYVDNEKGETGETDVIFRAKTSNPDKDGERGKRIVIVSDLHKDMTPVPAEAVKEFEFTQDRFRFEFIKDNTEAVGTNFVAYKSSANAYSFEMRCSAPWRVEEKPKWLTLNIENGDGTTYPTVSVTAANNVDLDWDKPREGKVVVLSDPEGNGSYSDRKELEFTQDKFVFEVTAEPKYDVDALNTNSYDIAVDVTAGASWKLSQSSTWPSPNKTSGTGSGIVKFTPSQNGTLSSRTTTMTLTCNVLKNSPLKTITVNQSAYRFDSTPVPLQEFVELNSSAQTVYVDCLGPWTVDNSYSSWLTVTPSSGTGNAILTVTTKNNTGAARGPVIFNVKSVVGGITHTKPVTVTQRDYQWTVVSNPGKLEADVLDGGNAEVKFKSSGAWTASANKEFVTVSPGSGVGVRDRISTVKIEVGANYLTTEQTAIVTIKSKDNTSLQIAANVSQPAYVWKVGKTGKAIDIEGGSVDATVDCSGKVKVDESTVPDWLEYKVSSGKVTFTAEKNETGAPRSAKITVKSEHYNYNNVLKGEIEVTQN